MSSQQQYSSQPPNQPQPITVELLPEIWFIGLAIVAIVAYLVKLELGVKDNRSRIEEIDEDVLPEIRRTVTTLESRNESRIKEMHGSISAEIHASLNTQQHFISSQFELILEKLNSRDAAIANLKEQINRQGADIREIEGHVKYWEHHHKKPD